MPLALIPFLLLVVPIVEIAAFVVIGGQIGLGWTLLMILVTAIIGTFFLRQQGFKVLETIKSETQAGRIPGRTLGDGAMILVAGILLQTPGFVPDSLGFLLFVPFVRSAIWSFLATRFSSVVVGTMGNAMGGAARNDDIFRDPSSRPTYDQDSVIDLDEDDYTRKPNPDSPWNDRK